MNNGHTRSDAPLTPPLGSTLTRLLNTPLRRADDESGFTIIEVMVAIFILLIGVLGAVTLTNTANAITNNNKAREGATNLSREIAEGARQVDYDRLNTAQADAALQAVQGLGDAQAGVAGWQVNRRAINYTVDVTACTYDDGKDGTRSSADTGSYCPASGAPVAPTTTQCASKNPAAGCLDANPDDFRRLTIKSTWVLSGTTKSSIITVLIVNPSGGLGPRITSVAVKVGAAAATAITTSGPGAPTKFDFTVTTDSRAQSVAWNADNNTSGLATAAGTNTWTFAFDIKDVAAAGAVLDGNYSITMQAFDGLGIPGDVKVSTLTVNRSLPFTPTNLRGGLDSRLTTVADMEWTANQERDIRGYRVYRVNGAPDWQLPRPVGDGSDPVVCGTATTALSAIFCFDPSWPTGSQSYYVKALDTDTSNQLRESTDGSTLLNLGPTPTIPAPDWGTATGTTPVPIVDGNPQLTWQAATPAAGHALHYYRIYRDGQTYADRYDHTATGADLTYTDRNPGSSTSHTYYVSAVDDTYQESPTLLGPLVSP
jgi:prepilin-type N-terminal cleavage/methylation domain-containing protein